MDIKMDLTVAPLMLIDITVCYALSLKNGLL